MMKTNNFIGINVLANIQASNRAHDPNFRIMALVVAKSKRNKEKARILI